MSKKSKVKSKKAASFNATPQEKELLKQQRDFVEKKNKCAKEITTVLAEYGFKLDVTVNPEIRIMPVK